jgi:hypothetical protein
MLVSRFTTALWVMAFASLIAFAPAGCSRDESSFTAPGTGLPASGNGAYPPEMPTGLTVVKATASGISLAWDANVEPDLAGYRLYIYDPSPYRSNSYVCVNESSLLGVAETRYLYPNDPSAGTLYFKLAAVDSDGNESVRCDPLAYDYAETDHSRYDELGGDSEYHSGALPGSGADEEPWTPGREDGTIDGGNTD